VAGTRFLPLFLGTGLPDELPPGFALVPNGDGLDFDHDSPSAAISRVFGGNQDAFKQVLAALYKSRRICCQRTGISNATVILLRKPTSADLGQE